MLRYRKFCQRGPTLFFFFQFLLVDEKVEDQINWTTLNAGLVAL